MLKKSKLAFIISGFMIFSANINAVENNDKLPVKEIRKIAEVFSKVDDIYVEQIDRKKMILAGIKGMVESLDPYSTYLEKEDFDEFMADTEGTGVGIGAILSVHKNGLQIETVLKDSPAEKSGLESGDVIIKVNGNYITEYYEKPFDAIKDIKGEINTDAKITLQKSETKEIKDISITRQVYVVPSTTVKSLDSDFGYIYISSFQENTKKDLEEQIKKFQTERPDTKGFILDLRSNPGGLLISAIEISDLFLNSGDIVSTKGRSENSDSLASATKGDILNGKPLVVLINNGTASAAEIVSGALQDNKRAIITGRTSYGKGSVQSIFRLNGSDGDGIKLTTARYYTPSGRSIQAEGIVPDIFIEKVKDVEVLEKEDRRENDNKNHISNDTNYKATTHEKESNKKDKEHLITSIKEDYALYEATNTLKTLIFSKNMKTK